MIKKMSTFITMILSLLVLTLTIDQSVSRGEEINAICNLRIPAKGFGYLGYEERVLTKIEAEFEHVRGLARGWYRTDPRSFNDIQRDCAQLAEKENRPGAYLLYGRGSQGFLPLYKRYDDSDAEQDWMIPAKSRDRTFTLFFMGTCSNTDDVNRKEKYWNGETVATLYHHAVEAGAIPTESTLAVNGPASGNLDTHRNFIDYEVEYSPVMGRIFGKGVTENLRNALAVLRLENENPLREDEVIKIRRKIASGGLGGIARVNMLGFSRGAVSAIQMAHDLANDPLFDDIEVNLFLIDPVPGFIAEYFWNDITTLPANVMHATVVYAEDDFSHGFAPVLPTPVSLRTELSLYSFPGYHPTLAGNHNGLTVADTRRYNLKSVSLIVRDMAEKFLTEHGTPLAGRLDYDDEDYLALYEEIANHHEGYRRLRQHAYLGISMRWWWNSRKLLTSRFGSTYMEHVPELKAIPGYINHHHHQLYQRLRADMY